MGDPGTLHLVGQALERLGLATLLGFVLPFAVLAVPALTAPFARGVIRTIDRVTETVLALAGWLALLIAIAQFVAVLARYMFGLSFTWLSEIVLYAFAGCFMLAAAGALQNDAHVRVDILYSRLPDRTKRLVNLFGVYLLLVPMMLLALWAFGGSLYSSWVNLEGSQETDGLPIKFLFKTLVPVFAVLFLAQGLSEALKSALALRGERPAHPDEHHEALV